MVPRQPRTKAALSRVRDLISTSRHDEAQASVGPGQRITELLFEVIGPPAKKVRDDG
jgi:hypothetical protein